MSSDLPYLSYISFYLISMHVLNSNQRTSTHWRLNIEEGKVQATVADGSAFDDSLNHLLSDDNDALMEILTNRITDANGDWVLEEPEETCNALDSSTLCSNDIETDVDQSYNELKQRHGTAAGPASYLSSSKADSSNKLEHQDPDTSSLNDSKANTGNSKASSTRPELDDDHRSNSKDSSSKKRGESETSKSKTGKTKNKNKEASMSSSTKKKKVTLDCGKVVNYTEYDELRGIANRHNHPHSPEPEVAMIFSKKGARNMEVDMSELEKRLKKSKKEKPRNAQVYNQIGNFWRIKGDAQMSIDCFRKALHYSTDNADVLLNLARVLFNLQYLEDAVFLTRRSLDKQPADQNSWLQHFTLGEILKAYGQFQEAALHFRHALDLNPGFHPAQAHLQEMESTPDATVTYYTLFIILFLVLGVLCGILTSIDGSLDEPADGTKTQRHFNRAMAMRSIKLGINPKLIKMRKQYNA